MKIVIIDGSKKHDNELTHCLEHIKLSLNQSNIEFQHILLKDGNIAPCINCRACTQDAGDEPGECVVKDDMTEIVQTIESADKFIFICPTALFTVNRVFRRFIDRLLMYAYWPRGNEKIRHRKRKTKQSLIITSNWAPYFIGKAFFNTEILINEACALVGAKTVGDIYLDPLWQKGSDKTYIERELNKLLKE